MRSSARKRERQMREISVCVGPIYCRREFLVNTHREKRGEQTGKTKVDRKKKTKAKIEIETEIEQKNTETEK